MITYHLNGRSPRGFEEKDLSRIAKGVFPFLKRPSKNSTYVVSIQWVSEAEMQNLNRVYRKKNRPTDVLAFCPGESMDGDSFPRHASEHEKDLGDLFICSSYARKEAKRRSIAFHEEIVRLIAHGTLHLMGYDHATDAEEERMFGFQEQVVDRIMRV